MLLQPCLPLVALPAMQRLLQFMFLQLVPRPFGERTRVRGCISVQHSANRKVSPLNRPAGHLLPEGKKDGGCGQMMGPNFEVEALRLSPTPL